MTHYQYRLAEYGTQVWPPEDATGQHSFGQCEMMLDHFPNARVERRAVLEDGYTQWDKMLPRAGTSVGVDIALSIDLGIDVESDAHDDGDEGPQSVRPGDLTTDQLLWIGHWLAGEGWERVSPR